MRQLVLSALAEIRRNQHALRAVSRRTPTPMLLPLLRACSFRLVNNAFAPRFRCDLARSLRYFLRPLLPLLRNRSVSRRQLPTEAIPPARRSVARSKDLIDASAAKDEIGRAHV